MRSGQRSTLAVADGCAATPTSRVVQTTMACWRGLMAAASACLLVLMLTVPATDAKALHRGFITMQNGKFVDQECREFNFVGANA